MKVLSFSNIHIRILLWVLFCFVVAETHSFPQAAGPLIVDASQVVQQPQPTSYTEGSHIAPDGRSLTLNERYLLRNGKPWLPVMGEIHYTRIPEQQWEPEILKMKAEGVQIIATYVIWIHHEEIEGQFDWQGRRELRRFIELCAKHGMYVQLRIGPWVHGEVRNGGFPDWLLKKVPPEDLRRNTPDYMSYVKKYYEQLGEQVKDLLWKDGGPILGIQVENEYSGRGPHGGAEYILALKSLAIQSGLDVPLYIVTGWDGAVVPQGAVLPVYGGYPDAPWDASLDQLPPSEVYAFRFRSRVAGSMGMMGAKRGGTLADAQAHGDETPFVTAEIGGGMQDTYHRRPVITADDIAAICPVMLGSGVNLYGTYMFHGGQNPEGTLSTLQESQTTGYPNDLPVKSYDFQAPLSEFGEERESFRKLKLFNYFLNDFGDRLAPLVTRAPEEKPSGPADFSVPRFSVRTNGADGFVFWNNYVRGSKMPAWAGIQIAVKLPTGVLKVPRQPINIPSGAYFIWPFNLDLNGVMLKYSTAQLFTRITANQTETYYFFAIPGIPAEFAFEQSTVSNIRAKGGRVGQEGGVSYVSGLAPGLTSDINLRAGNGTEVRIVLLSQDQAESAWKVKIGTDEHLLFTSQQFFSDPSHIYLQSISSPKFDFQIEPPVSQPFHANLPVREGTPVGGVSVFTATAPEAKLRPVFKQTRSAGMTPQVSLGPSFAWRKHSVAQVPDDSAFDRAAEWNVTIPQPLPPELSEIFLQVKYAGDVARLSSNGKLLEDDFYNGLTWSIGLDRFRKALQGGPLQLQILPLRKDAPIFIEKRYWPAFPENGQLEELQSLTLVPEYQLTLDTGQQ